MMSQDYDCLVFCSDASFSPIIWGIPCLCWHSACLSKCLHEMLMLYLLYLEYCSRLLLHIIWFKRHWVFICTYIETYNIFYICSIYAYRLWIYYVYIRWAQLSNLGGSCMIARRDQGILISPHCTQWDFSGKGYQGSILEERGHGSG